MKLVEMLAVCLCVQGWNLQVFMDYGSVVD